MSESQKTESKSKKKKWIWVLIPTILALLALLLGSLYWYTSKTKSKVVNSSVLLREFGEVLFKLPNDKEYTQLKNAEVDLPSSSQVKTLDGSAHVLFANNSLLSLDKNTEITLTFTQSEISINQLAGNTWSRVKTLTTGENYKVETPTALASVRGTKFAVEMDNSRIQGITGVYVIESKVAINSKIKPLETEKILTEGEYGELDKVGNLVSGNLVKTDLQGRWYRRNKIIDTWYDQVGTLNRDSFTQILYLEDLLGVDSGSFGPTKKDNCLDLLVQKDSQNQIHLLKIIKPLDASVFQEGQVIEVEANGTDLCSKKSIENITWSIAGKEMAKGEKSQISGLEAGTYEIKASGNVGDEELSDAVNISVVKINSSSSSSSTSSKSSSSSSRKVTVKPNQNPIVAISSPKNGGVYTATAPTFSVAALTPTVALNLSGSASDPEEGDLNGNSVTWSITPNYFAPNPLPTGSNIGNVTFKTTAGTSTVYTITMTATDSKGLSSSSTITITVKNP